jgi:hypothetical protein
VFDETTNFVKKQVKLEIGLLFVEELKNFHQLFYESKQKQKKIRIKLPHAAHISHS